MDKLSERSKAQVIGWTNAKTTWDEWEKHTVSSFGGGYHKPEELLIYQHGMKTVFNMLRAEMPSPNEVAQLEEGIEHIKKWAEQPTDSLRARQVADAVIRMCDDALKAGGEDGTK